MNNLTCAPATVTPDTFRPCYLCGMPRLDYDLCDACADGCVADGEHIEEISLCHKKHIALI